MVFPEAFPSIPSITKPEGCPKAAAAVGRAGTKARGQGLAPWQEGGCLAMPPGSTSSSKSLGAVKAVFLFPALSGVFCAL